MEYIGAPAVDALILALRDGNHLVRYGAAEILGRLSDPRSIEPLIQVFQNADWISHDVAIEALASIGAPAIDGLQRIAADPQTTPDVRQEILRAIENIMVETVVFGTLPRMTAQFRSTLFNPDVSLFTLPMSHLKALLLDAETCNMYQVEQFLTYAVNYVGQKRLKNHVTVHIYGDSSLFSVNLLNNFAHLFYAVQMHAA